MAGAGTPSRPAAPARGFTLLEIMAVCALLGILLYLLPARLDGFGSRSRLVSAANTVVAAFTGAKEQAVIDGHEVRIQFLLGGERAREDTGKFRHVVINQTREAERNGEDGQPRSRESMQEEMIALDWRGLPDGVHITGFSIQREAWATRNNGDQPFEVTFYPDGSVRPACAVRVESVDLPPGSERVMTVVVNALTATPMLVEGEAELPPSLDASEFR